MTAYKIEKNIPINGYVQLTARKDKYPFRFMKIGDSFFAKEKKMNTISVSVAGYNKKLFPKRFAARTVEGGVRVWRVK